MSTIAPVLASSASFTVNATSWTNNTVITTDALNIAALSPIPLDILITVSFVCPNSAPSANAVVNVYKSESEDGTNYDENDQYSGTNNTQTALRSPTNLKFLSAIAVNQNITGKRIIRLLDGLFLPRKAGIILENKSGLTLTSPTVTYTAFSEAVT